MLPAVLQRPKWRAAPAGSAGINAEGLARPRSPVPALLQAGRDFAGVSEARRANLPFLAFYASGVSRLPHPGQFGPFTGTGRQALRVAPIDCDP